jgi:hypothetical protein
MKLSSAAVRRVMDLLKKIDSPEEQGASEGQFVELDVVCSARPIAEAWTMCNRLRYQLVEEDLFRL